MNSVSYLSTPGPIEVQARLTDAPFAGFAQPFQSHQRSTGQRHVIRPGRGRTVKPRAGGSVSLVHPTRARDTVKTSRSEPHPSICSEPADTEWRPRTIAGTVALNAGSRSPRVEFAPGRHSRESLPSPVRRAPERPCVSRPSEGPCAGRGMAGPCHGRQDRSPFSASYQKPVPAMFPNGSRQATGSGPVPSCGAERSAPQLGRRAPSLVSSAGLEPAHTAQESFGTGLPSMASKVICLVSQQGTTTDLSRRADSEPGIIAANSLAAHGQILLTVDSRCESCDCRQPRRLDYLALSLGQRK
jgi:hypothetical protein